MESHRERQQPHRNPRALSAPAIPPVHSAEDVFGPPRWLRNRHVQSMLASTAWRRGRVLERAAPLLAAQREVLLDCGAGVRLQCFVSGPAEGPGRPVVLLHGWEGSADSLYLLSLAQLLFEQRFEVVRLNLRDHGDTHHLNRELFHSCRLPEVVGAVRALQQHFAGRPLQLVGFSLGGNFMLRVAAQAREAALDLERVIAVSPVLDPARAPGAIPGAVDHPDPLRGSLRILRATHGPQLARAAHPRRARRRAPQRTARFSSNSTTGSPLVTVTAPSMIAPLATAILRATMSAWSTAVAPTSSLSSTTSFPEIFPAITAACA